MVVWLIYTGILFYMEMVFHLRFFGFQGGNPLFPLGLLLLVTSLQALVTGWFGPRGAKRAFRIMMWIQFLIFAVQTVYFTIFRQPLQLAAMLVGGQDALTNYWREALAGFLKAVPVLLLLALPILVSEVLWKLKRWRLRELEGIQKLRLGLSAWMLLLYCICCILIGDMAGADYSEEYQEYYDPETVMRNMGVIAMVQRDGFYELSNLFHREDAIPAEGTTVVQDLPQQNEPPGKEAGELEPVDLTDERTEDSAEQPPEPDVTPEPEPEEPDTSPHAWDIDLEKLGALSGDNKETTWLADYIAGQTPTNRNEYTGMFEGYNLIFLTAEGFSTYAIREDLTPTLYKMVNSSFVFPNYYVPLWQIGRASCRERV